MKSGENIETAIPSFDHYAPRSRHGLTLIEMLVASLIVAVALIAMVGTWRQMFSATLLADQRGAAYQCARMVMERSRSLGFHTTLPAASSHNLGSSQLVDSPVITDWRYFDNNVQELDAGDGNPPALAAGSTARFLVLTHIAYPQPRVNSLPYPSGRPDLSLMAISVDVYDASLGAGSTPIYSLQTCLTEGGI